MSSLSRFAGIAGDSKWKDPLLLALWCAEQKEERRKRRSSSARISQDSTVLDFPLLTGVARSAYAPDNAHALARTHAEQWATLHDGRYSLTQRARLLDGATFLPPKEKRDARTSHRPP